MGNIHTEATSLLILYPALIGHLVMSGHRPDMNDIPKEVSENEIYLQMISCCWNQNPEKRPEFQEIKAVMKTKLDEFYFRTNLEISIIVNKRIQGLAWLENKIYVVGLGCEKILPYSDSKPFKLLDGSYTTNTNNVLPN